MMSGESENKCDLKDDLAYNNGAGGKFGAQRKARDSFSPDFYDSICHDYPLS